MKTLKKITLGIVTILSLCSCGKVTKTSREAFLIAANNIETKNTYIKAEIVYLLTKTNTELGQDKKTEKYKYIASYIKNDDQWIKSEDSDEAAAYLFRRYVLNYPAIFFASTYFEMFDVNSEYVTYYLNPFGVEYSQENVAKNNVGEFKSSLYYYFTWNKYGLLTSAEMKHEENMTGDDSCYYSTIGKLRITYR